MFYATPSKGYFVYFNEKCDDLLAFSEVSNITNACEFGHAFCGMSTLSNATCPNCQRPFVRYLKLDNSDQRLALAGFQAPSLELMYCFRCDLSNHDVTDASDYRRVYLRSDVPETVFLSGSYGDPRYLGGAAPFYYQVTVGEISLIQYRIGRVQSHFPYENYPDFFPECPARLLDISASAQQILRNINSEVLVEWNELKPFVALNRPRHQVGGEPYLSQHDTEYEMICPLCVQVMPFLYGSGEDCLDPRGMAGNELVQVLFHYCKACSVVGAVNQV
jgi:hypothetical protein